MSEQNKPFVVTDRRKFTSDGTPRLDADPSPEREARETQESRESREASEAQQPSQTTTEPHHTAETIEFPSSHVVDESPAAEPTAANSAASQLPPAPSAEEREHARLAYQQTTDHLETAVRAANPGVDHPPPMSFAQIVQSVYMTAIMQLGGGTQPGQQPKIDLMGARQSIDMLAIIAEKTVGNLSEPETRLIDTALYEIRLGFLEVTQALTRSAARNPPPPGTPGVGPLGPIPPGRPTIVR
jgi:hypothetical protein